MKRMVKKYTPQERQSLVDAMSADVTNGMSLSQSAQGHGVPLGTAYQWMSRSKLKKQPKAKKGNEVIVVNSDTEKESEDVKIVVMKGPGHVIEKIAAALSGVL